MDSYLKFIVGVVLLAYISYRVARYFRPSVAPLTDDIKGGVVKALFVFLIVGLISFLAGCSVFAGIDYTEKVSPQCMLGGLDDRATSNLGFRGMIYQDDRLTVSAKYTHHSCAWSTDQNVYDGVGIELEYWIIQR